MAHRLDDAVLGKRPSLKWRSCLGCAEIVVAVHLRRFSIDGNYLPMSHVTGDPLKSDAEAMLDHLHPAAYAQDGQIPFVRNIDQRIFRGVAFRRVAAVGRQGRFRQSGESH